MYLGLHKLHLIVCGYGWDHCTANALLIHTKYIILTAQTHQEHFDILIVCDDAIVHNHEF